jgi:nucleotide-binding universal stress UspA family protein
MSNNNVILVPHDFTKVAECALNHAVKLIETLQGEIVLLHIIAKESEEGNAKNQLAVVVDTIKKDHKIECRALVQLGNIFDDIAAVAQREHARLIVMGTHGVKGMQFLTGSLALKVITKSRIPFMVVQEKDPHSPYDRIVCPLDFNKDTKQKVRLVATMAKNLNAKVFIIVPSATDEFLVNEINRNIGFTESTLEKMGVAYELHTAEKGNFTKSIIKYSTSVDADMIAMVNDDNGSLPSFIGGSEEQSIITNEAQIPTLIVNAAQVSGSVGIIGS